MPTRAGDEIAKGLGPQSADAALRQRLVRACKRQGGDVVDKALSVDEATILQFAAWFQAIEHKALQDTEHGYRATGRSGDAATGIPCSLPMRLVAEVPLALEWLMERPEEFLVALDKGRGIVV